MTAEHILDAMNELPDHLLQQTDAIRHRKRIRWEPFVAAACLCVAVGAILGLLQGPTKEAFDGAVGNAAPDCGALEDKVDAESTTGLWWSATVLTVEQEQLTVRLDSGREVVVLLSELDLIPEFTPGQKIRIYLKDGELPADTPLKPYKIEIKED